MNIGRPLRVAASIALLIGGAVHLQLYFEGYRSIDRIGPSFLLNAISSGVVAALLAARREWLVRLAGIGVALGTIAAFVVSRQGDGLFNFREHGLNPSPQATIALVVEIAAIVLLAATFLPAIVDEQMPSSIMLLATSTAFSAVALIGLGAYWAGHYDATPKATDGGVQLSGFKFGPASLNVKTGTTVTWTNTDPVVHSVVATDTSFFSPIIAHGKTFSHTFDTAGTITYVCGIHSQMKGTITVAG